MTCIDGVDPADFKTGGILPPDDDPTPEATRFDISDGTFVDLGPSARTMEFIITPTPVRYSEATSVQYSTVNGSAIGGTHFVAQSNVVVNFAAGDGAKTIVIQVLTPAGISGSKAFQVTLSSPSAGETIGDGTGDATIFYTGGPPPDTDPATFPSFISWPRDRATVYDQFRSCPDSCAGRCGGCNYYGACTGFCGAGFAQLHEWLDAGKSSPCFDAKKLYTDAGGPGANASCDGGGWFGAVVRDYLAGKTNNHYGGTGQGAKRYGLSTFRKIASWSQITSSDGTMATLIKQLKRSIYRNGGVWLDSIFYAPAANLDGLNTDWNSSGNWNQGNYILANPGTNGRSNGGHSWMMIGWNNNVNGTGIGAFLMQSSHGNRWGNSGRAWLPYSYLKLSGSAPNPWYRYSEIKIKAGG